MIFIYLQFSSFELFSVSLGASSVPQTFEECFLATRNAGISKIIFMSFIAKSECDGTEKKEEKKVDAIKMAHQKINKIV